MAQQKITLRKIRDFGENFNETFGFIRQEFSPLLKSFLAVGVIFMVMHSIAVAWYSSEQSSVFNDIFKGITTRREMSDTFTLGYFLNIGLYYVLYCAMHTAITAYFIVYEEKQGESPTMPEVWNCFARNFLKVVLYSIPTLIVTLIGLVLCLVPGVYFGVVLAPFATVVMVEGRSFTDSFNRCFQIIRENFWVSLAIYFVSYIVYSFMSGIISFILGIIFGVTAFMTTKQFGTAYVLIMSATSIFQFIFYIVFYVSVILNYYSLVERTDGTGLMDRINAIGDKEQSMFDNTGEF